MLPRRTLQIYSLSLASRERNLVQVGPRRWHDAVVRHWRLFPENPRNPRQIDWSYADLDGDRLLLHGEVRRRAPAIYGGGGAGPVGNLIRGATLLRAAPRDARNALATQCPLSARPRRIAATCCCCRRYQRVAHRTLARRRHSHSAGAFLKDSDKRT